MGVTLQFEGNLLRFVRAPFSCPEPTILLACGRNRELWEQPFRACAIDEDLMKPDGQNSVISFVISKWLLPELSIPAAGQKDGRLQGRECTRTCSCVRVNEAKSCAVGIQLKTTSNFSPFQVAPCLRLQYLGWYKHFSFLKVTLF